MKVKSVMVYLLIALVLPLAAVAQYSEDAAAEPGTEAAVAAPKDAGGEAKSAAAPKAAKPKAAAVQGKDIMPGAPGWLKGVLNAVVKIFSYVGNIFGDAAGIRIGGATVTAVVALVVAQAIKDRVPDWVKYLLYGTGGTMFASGGVDIAQLVQQFLK